MIRKFIEIFYSAFYIIFTVFISVLLSSCDTCEYQNGGNSGEDINNRIFFTAYPVSGLTPSVYSCNPDGSGRKLVIKNATIYSAPSADGKIAVLQFDSTEAKNMIYMYNSDGTNGLYIDEDNLDYGVALPNLSPNGNKIAFFGGNSRLYLWVLDLKTGGSFINKISNLLYDKSLSQFSPNGKYLAFFEKNAGNGVVFKVIETETPDVIVFSIIIDGLLNSKTETSASWDIYSNKVSFCANESGNDIIYIIDLNSGGIIKKDMNITGAKSSVISPDGNFVVFTDNDGGMWAASSVDDQNTELLEDAAEGETNIFPEWSQDGKYIMFNKFFSDNADFSFSTLKCFEIEKTNNKLTSKKQYIVGNNAYRAYWKRNK